MNFIYITNDIEQARIAEVSGVDKIMIDLEINGKQARQGHLDTVISNHSLSDISLMRPVLKKSELLVRVNPVYKNSEDEINQCIDRGADQLMLPMFGSASEVERFLALVNGRAATCLLLETPAALARIGEIAAITGVEDIHIGLNDLHIGLGLDFMFEILSGGLIDYCAAVLKEHEVSFGFGGVARLGTGMLSSNQILWEHIRVGSEQVILSRDFMKIFEESEDVLVAETSFIEEVKKMRTHLRVCAMRDDQSMLLNKLNVHLAVQNIIKERHNIF